MFLHVNEAKYIDDYIIELKFNNNVVKKVDLEKELFGEVFEPLKDKTFFKDFIISHNTIEWKNGADFAPEYLFEIGQAI